MPVPRSNPSLISALAIFLVFLIILSPQISAVISTYIGPQSDGECDQCHGGFTPFLITPDSPSVVPDGMVFDYTIIIKNPWEHDIRGLEVDLDLSQAPYLFDPNAGNETIESENLEGSTSAGSSTSSSIEVDPGATEVLLQLLYTAPFFFAGDANLRLTGPNGGSWVSDLSDTTEVIRIGEDEILEEGYGEYTWTITNEAVLRDIDYDLSITIRISRTSILRSEADPIGSEGEARVTFRLGTSGMGENRLSYVVTGVVHHEHDNDHADQDTYTVEGDSSVEVGDEYVYSPPGRKISSSTALWYAGRMMAFVTVILFILSFLSGGSIDRVGKWMKKRFKNPNKVHCNISKLVVLSALVHLTLLYSSYYSGTGKGLVVGVTMLLLMLVLGITGALRTRISNKIGERNWRRIHFWISIAVMVLIAFHAVDEGTDLAFLRFF